MPPSAQIRKFERRSADVRRQVLIDAAIHCITDNGYAATGVRDICARAGVSPGLLRHYFDSKDDLIAQAFRQAVDQFIADICEASSGEGDDPRHKLRAFVDACFDGQISRDYLATILAFWSELRLQPRMRVLVTELFEAYRNALIDVIEDVARIEGNADEVDAILVAISLTALIDGLWLEMSLNPSGFDTEDARLACFGLLDGFLFCGTNEKWLQIRGAGRGI